MLNVKITPADEFGKKALQGLYLVEVKPYDGGLKLRGRKIQEEKILLTIQWKLEKALKEVIELQGIEGIEKVEKAYTTNEMVDILLNPHSGYIGSPCTDMHRRSLVIALLQDALALVRYIVGEDIFDSHYNI